MTALTAPFFLQQLTDTSGKPLSNGKLFSYVGGSTNLPKPIYYDKDYTTPCPNPLIADASGILPQYFMTSGYYKFEVKTAADVIIATRDYIEAGGNGGGGTVDDHKVAVDQYDTNPDYLSNKIQSGNGTTAVEVIGATRYMQIDSKGYVGVDASDQHINYLDQKLVSSPSVTMSAYNIGTPTDQNWVMTANVDNSYGQVIPVWCILPYTVTNIPPFNLPQSALEEIYQHHYGVAHGDMNPPEGQLAIWYLEGGTYWGDAIWVQKGYYTGQAIINMDYGTWDYLHTHPEDIINDEELSNYPAGLYIAKREGDGFHWAAQVINQYPDPQYSTDSVLTYNGYTKTFNWTATSAFEGDGSVKIDVNDSAGFLGYKVQAGPSITITNTYNSSYGNFLSLSASGSNPSGGSFVPTVAYAAATDVVMPQSIGNRSELLVLFIPPTDITLTMSSLVGTAMLQGATGTMHINIRQALAPYDLILAGGQITNPTSNTFLESIPWYIRDPATGLDVSTYTLRAGIRYYFSINYSFSSATYMGCVGSQNTNITPLPSFRVDNLNSGAPLTLTGGSETLQRPYLRVRNIG